MGRLKNYILNVVSVTGKLKETSALFVVSVWVVDVSSTSPEHWAVIIFISFKNNCVTVLLKFRWMFPGQTGGFNKSCKSAAYSCSIPQKAADEFYLLSYFLLLIWFDCILFNNFSFHCYFCIVQLLWNALTSLLGQICRWSRTLKRVNTLCRYCWAFFSFFFCHRCNLILVLISRTFLLIHVQKGGFGFGWRRADAYKELIQSVTLAGTWTE